MLPPGTFAEDVVAITGGGTGLGRAMAVEFARLGAAVAVLSRSVEHLEQGAAAIRAAGGRAIVAPVDVRDPDAVETALDSIEDQAGRPVSVLVNNAAGNFASPAEDLSARAWRAVTQIVLDGTFLMSSSLARRCQRHGEGAAILNVGASYGWTGGPGAAHSAAAKAGVMNLVQTLAVEWAPLDIRVNGIVPGPFPHGDFPEALHRQFDAGLGSRRVPLGRVGALHEIGWAATYLCSRYAAFVTGHNFVIDGGSWLRRGLALPEFVPIRDQLGHQVPAVEIAAPGTEPVSG